jgi:hypothetical protein
MREWLAAALVIFLIGLAWELWRRPKGPRGNPA